MLPPITGLSRRGFLQQLGLHALTLLPALCPARALALPAPASTTSPFLQGINAYYLQVEAYRRAARGKFRHMRGAIHTYLTDELQLPAVQQQCRINSIRYWAFNDYPDLHGIAPDSATDGRLWRDSRQVDESALETLGMLSEDLEQLGFTLVPVLSNFWPSYGGILQYLSWAGELSAKDYVDALCGRRTVELYEAHTIPFFTSPAAEQLFRQHLDAILNALRPLHAIHTLELMNEPRGKNVCSLENRPLPDGRMSADVVASWLNRQATWIRQRFFPTDQTPFLSSGEEGWLELPPAGAGLHALTPAGQAYEGIDLKKNLSWQPDGISIGSVHMYPHPVTALPQKNICGDPFTDRRGWGHLSNDPGRADMEHFVTLGEEWLDSRADALRGSPWYIGEMGWCRPSGTEGHTPAACPELRRERHRLYRRWSEQARDRGAVGVFVWMLNGQDHADDFYGMDRHTLASVFTETMS